MFDSGAMAILFNFALFLFVIFKFVLPMIKQACSEESEAMSGLLESSDRSYQSAKENYDLWLQQKTQLSETLESVDQQAKKSLSQYESSLETWKSSQIERFKKDHEQLLSNMKRKEEEAIISELSLAAIDKLKSQLVAEKSTSLDDVLVKQSFGSSS